MGIVRIVWACQKFPRVVSDFSGSHVFLHVFFDSGVGALTDVISHWILIVVAWNGLLMLVFSTAFGSSCVIRATVPAMKAMKAMRSMASLSAVPVPRLPRRPNSRPSS